MGKTMRRERFPAVQIIRRLREAGTGLAKMRSVASKQGTTVGQMGLFGGPVRVNPENRDPRRVVVQLVQGRTEPLENKGFLDSFRSGR